MNATTDCNQHHPKVFFVQPKAVRTTAGASQELIKQELY